MRLSVIIGIIIGLVLAFVIGWLIYSRFIKPRMKSKSIAKSEGETANNPTQTQIETPEEETKPEIEAEVSEPDLNKWKGFKFSKRVNETKINNDIAINENNMFDNPDIEEIFKRPVEVDKSLYVEDKIGDKIDLSTFKKISYDSYAYPEIDDNIKPFDEDNTIDMNVLDNVDFPVKNIESALTAQPDEQQPAKVLLIDNEVFGW